MVDINSNYYFVVNNLILSPVDKVQPIICISNWNLRSNSDACNFQWMYNGKAQFQYIVAFTGDLYI